jgi:oligopeptide/dipeptide ABC transporter ATP-binding protein
LNKLVEVEELTKYFQIGTGFLGRHPENIHAVDHISFNVRRGQTFGLVGESACGKTTTAKLLLRLIQPTSGRVIFDGIEIFKLSKKELRELRRRIQIVFQDPYSSLNPRLTVRKTIGMPLKIHGIASGHEADLIVGKLLERVGLEREHMNRFPHEFSGGQRQRIGIARALAADPDFIILDEPTSELDVAVQAQILNDLVGIQSSLNLTFLLISHNLAVIRHMCDVVAVMYAGRIVEIADADKLFSSPGHPYTRALMSAVPVPDPAFQRNKLVVIGEPPSLVKPPSGCRFHPRCPFSIASCSVNEPTLLEKTPGQLVACPVVN